MIELFIYGLYVFIFKKTINYTANRHMFTWTITNRQLLIFMATLQ